MIRFHALWRPQIVAAPHNTDSPFFCLAAQFHRMEVHSFSPKFSSDTVDIFGKDPTVSQRFLFFLFFCCIIIFGGHFCPYLIVTDEEAANWERERVITRTKVFSVLSQGADGVCCVAHHHSPRHNSSHTAARSVAVSYKLWSDPHPSRIASVLHENGSAVTLAIIHRHHLVRLSKQNLPTNT